MFMCFALSLDNANKGRFSSNDRVSVRDLQCIGAVRRFSEESVGAHQIKDPPLFSKQAAKVNKERHLEQVSNVW
jgi:hypothetical protein